MEHGCLAEARWTYDSVRRASFDLQVEIFKEVPEIPFCHKLTLIVFRGTVFTLGFGILVTKADVPKLYQAPLEDEILGIRRFLDGRLLLEYIVKVFNIHL